MESSTQFHFREGSAAIVPISLNFHASSHSRARARSSSGSARRLSTASCSRAIRHLSDQIRAAKFTAATNGLGAPIASSSRLARIASPAKFAFHASVQAAVTLTLASGVAMGEERGGEKEDRIIDAGDA